MKTPHFKINVVSGMASAWMHDEAGTRAHVVHYKADDMYHWHITQHGRDGEPTQEGRTATASQAFAAATKALGAKAYKLS